MLNICNLRTLVETGDVLFFVYVRYDAACDETQSLSRNALNQLQSGRQLSAPQCGNDFSISNRYFFFNHLQYYK